MALLCDEYSFHRQATLEGFPESQSVVQDLYILCPEMLETLEQIA